MVNHFAEEIQCMKGQQKSHPDKSEWLICSNVKEYQASLAITSTGTSAFTSFMR